MDANVEAATPHSVIIAEHSITKSVEITDTEIMHSDKFTDARFSHDFRRVSRDNVIALCNTPLQCDMQS